MPDDRIAWGTCHQTDLPRLTMDSCRDQVLPEPIYVLGWLQHPMLYLSGRTEWSDSGARADLL